MSLLVEIDQKLREAFHPRFLEVEDFSYLHKGHREIKTFLTKQEENYSFPTHIKITLVSLAFKGLSRLECQRKVYAILGEQIVSSVHAITLSLSVPKENQ